MSNVNGADNQLGSPRDWQSGTTVIISEVTHTHTHTHTPNARGPEYCLLPGEQDPARQKSKQVSASCRFVGLLDPTGTNVTESAGGRIYLCHCLQHFLQTDILACCQERSEAKRDKAVSTVLLHVGLSGLQLFKLWYLELWWWWRNKIKKKMTVVVVVVCAKEERRRRRRLIWGLVTEILYIGMSSF